MTETSIVLECDTCGIRRQSDLGESIEELRTRLAGVGWLIKPALDFDLCPRCLAAGFPDGQPA